MASKEESGPTTRRVLREVYGGNEDALKNDPHFTKEKKSIYEVEMPDGSLDWMELGRAVRELVLNLLGYRFLEKHLKKRRHTISSDKVSE